MGRNIDRLIAPQSDGLHHEAREITQQIAEGRSSFVETQRRRKGGTLLHVSILGKPILLGDDQIAIYGIYRDITARKQAEAALTASHATIERLHEAANALGAAETEDDVYQITCDAAEQVLGVGFGILYVTEGSGFVCRATSSPIGARWLGRSRVDPAGLAVKTLESEGPILVHDAEPHSLPEGIPPTSRSLLCVPIGEVGVFLAASTAPNAFSGEDGRLLGILLGHTAVAVSRLRLQEELIRQARHDADRRVQPPLFQ
mgnify:CR=1 FL=1